MHRKALTMLHEYVPSHPKTPRSPPPPPPPPPHVRLAKEEDDKLDRYPPTISYLHKLGAADLDLVLESSKWILEEDPAIGLTVRSFSLSSPAQEANPKQQIFTADEPEIESLPRDRITSFLSSIDQKACTGYLEYIIWTLGEVGAEFHDQLAGLYMVDSRAEAQGQGQGQGQAQDGKEEKGNEYAGGAYNKLLRFLNDSNYYRPYRVMNKLSGDGAFRFSFFMINDSRLTTDDWREKKKNRDARSKSDPFRKDGQA